MKFDSWKKNKNEAPVDIFLDSLSEGHIAWMIKKAEYYSLLPVNEMIKLGFIEKSEKGLWELKFKCPSKFFPVRIFYVSKGIKNILLHSFKKKYNGAIRQKEINLALTYKKILDSDSENQKINNI